MLKSVLIANRGEVAIRIARAARELGLRTVAVHSEDDAASLHTRGVDLVRPLAGHGPAAYLDISGIVAAAQAAGADAVHPGYGFLSENAGLARACAAAGLVFVGPGPATLDVFGDKMAARALAQDCNVPVARGRNTVTDAADAAVFLASLGPGGGMMIKAAAGGGGRGMRLVARADAVAEAHARCQSEALAAFGLSDVYVEEIIARARHIEIQIVGDGSGAVVHLGARECSLQRRYQKIVEIAPSPSLSDAMAEQIAAAALRMAAKVAYRGLGTFEFLVGADNRFVFIEANARLQVEHTVTEAITGLDLVQTQLRIAGGASLADLGLTRPPPARGFAMQLRINLETMGADGSVRPEGGTITTYEVPSGPGIRVDGFGYGGYRTSPRFDSLLAKLIVHVPSGDFSALVARVKFALAEFRIAGVATNIGFLASLLRHPDVLANDVHTAWVDAHAAVLVGGIAIAADSFFAVQTAIFAATATAGPPGTQPVLAPMQGLVVAVDVAEGAIVRAGQQVAVLEAMKMQHVVAAAAGGVVRLVAASPGEVMADGQAMLFIEPQDVADAAAAASETVDLDFIRLDLAEAIARHALTLDAARPAAVAKRAARNHGRTARANVEDLLDPGSFTEYGALTLAAQRSRHSIEHLKATTPADGLVGGIGTVNAGLFGEEAATTVVVAYDYTVLAGTQGTMNHKKQDRIYAVAEEIRRPLVLLAEGGGGRPGDTDKALLTAGTLDVKTFWHFARLSGLIPLIGVVNGRCFAGNAALLGCCDVIIATESTTMGMGGPAMIEGGGLGVYTPEEVGPVGVQGPNGVIDVLVTDEAAAVATAKQYLSYFQGSVAGWTCPDQRALRRLIPENRLRVYDIRQVIAGLADTGSVLELRAQFGVGIITALIRIEGRPMGLLANNPMHLGGAIDAEAADKAARFLQMCDAHDLPILSLCDTPGFMVGPEAEKSALVRRVCRMFVNGASLTVPFFTVVLRKGYGLGAQAMAGGCFHRPIFNVAWPTGEFGGMGLEGAVRLAYRKELAAIEDPVAQDAEFRRRVDAMYASGKAIESAAMLEIDDVIDPAETRRWLMRGLRAAAKPLPRNGKKRLHIETW